MGHYRAWRASSSAGVSEERAMWWPSKSPGYSANIGRTDAASASKFRGRIENPRQGSVTSLSYLCQSHKFRERSHLLTVHGHALTFTVGVGVRGNYVFPAAQAAEDFNFTIPIGPHLEWDLANLARVIDRKAERLIAATNDG